MKRILTALFSIMLLFSMNSTIFAQEDVDGSPVLNEGEQNEPAPEPVLFDAGEDAAEPEVIAVENQTFIIYTEETCPHCKNVKEFVRLNELEEYIEYIDITNNDDNFAKLEASWEEFGLEDAGWPFMLYNDGEEDTYAVGDEPIIDALIAQLNIEDPVREDPEESDNTVLLLLGGAFFVAIVGYGAYSFFTKKDE